MFFAVNATEGPVHNISNLEVVGSYSIDADRRYRNDLSQLKYYKEPDDIKHVNFDLKKNKSTISKWQTDTKLKFILTWMSEHFEDIKIQNLEEPKRWLQPEIVCIRGLLKTLLVTPYEKSAGWIICASKFKGTIYLCKFDTESRKALQESSYARACTRWGYVFEEHMLSDTPNTDPDASKPLSRKGEFCCVFKAHFGETTLLYGAEVDGVSCEQIVEDTVAGKKLEFVELKTVLAKEFVKGRMQTFFKSLIYWAQSYSVAIQDIICGCKDYNGVVREIKKLKQHELVPLEVQEDCLRFCSDFLERIKKIVTEDYNKCLYKFTYFPGRQEIGVEKMKPDPASEYTCLPSWYIKKANEHFYT